MHIVLRKDGKVVKVSRQSTIVRGQSGCAFITVEWSEAIIKTGLNMEICITRPDSQQSGWLPMVDETFPNNESLSGYIYYLSEWDTEVSGEANCAIRWYYDDSTSKRSTSSIGFIIDNGVIAQPTMISETVAEAALNVYVQKLGEKAQEAISKIQTNSTITGIEFVGTSDDGGNVYEYTFGEEPDVVKIRFIAPRGPAGPTGAKIISCVFKGRDENGGNIYLQTFDDGSTTTFVAPRGLTGPQGPQGEQGVQGEQGIQGPQGLQGEKGYIYFDIGKSGSKYGDKYVTRVPVIPKEMVDSILLTCTSHSEDIVFLTWLDSGTGKKHILQILDYDNSVGRFSVLVVDANLYGAALLTYSNAVTKGEPCGIEFVNRQIHTVVTTANSLLDGIKVPSLSLSKRNEIKQILNSTYQREILIKWNDGLKWHSMSVLYCDGVVFQLLYRVDSVNYILTYAFGAESLPIMEAITTTNS